MAGGVKFIRVNGRVIPVKDKGPSDQQRKKNYEKHGDGASHASEIDYKHSKKASNIQNKGQGKAALAGAAAGAAATVAIGAAQMKRKVALSKFGLKGTGLMLIAGAAAAHTLNRFRNKSKYKAQLHKNDVDREKQHIRAFGTTSEGYAPSKTRTGV